MKLPWFVKKQNKKNMTAADPRVLKLDPVHQDLLLQGKGRAIVIGKLVAAVAGIVVVMLFWKQIVRGGYYSEAANAQIMGEHTEISPRGSIVDRNGEELAVSIISKSLYVDPQELVDDPERWPLGQMPSRDPKRVAADQLAPILDMKADALYERFTEPDRRFAWVKRQLDPHVADEVEKVLKDQKLSGFHFQEESKRYYTKDKLAAQVLGFVGDDGKGLKASRLPWTSTCGARIRRNAASSTPRVIWWARVP